MVPLSEKPLTHLGFSPQSVERGNARPRHWTESFAKSRFMGEGLNAGFFGLSLLHNVPTLMNGKSSPAEKQQAAAGLATTGGLTAALSPSVQNQVARFLQGPTQQAFLKYGSKLTRLGGPILGGVGLGFSLIDTKNTFEKPEATFADKATAVTNNVGMSLAMVPVLPVTLSGLGLFAFSELGGVKFIAEGLPDEVKKWFAG
jgi:hypothetical protein